MIIRIPQVFNEELYRLVLESTDRKICSFIIEQFDEAMCDGQFDFCNEVIKTIDVTKLNSQAMCSLVICARWGRKEIPEYDKFYQTVYAIDAAKHGSERADSIYRNLK